MMNYYRPGLGGWAMGWMIVSNVAFLALLAVAAALLIRYTRRGRVGPSSPMAVTPQQLLAERFARGEIDEDQYTRQLQVLNGTTALPRAHL
jgi:putative membrane protein